jgi:hypothetical protein
MILLRSTAFNGDAMYVLFSFSLPWVLTDALKLDLGQEGDTVVDQPSMTATGPRGKLQTRKV